MPRKPSIKKSEILALREQHLTYREIAERLGCTTQYIAQVCGKHQPHMFHVISNKVIYPNIRNWMNENKISMNELCRRVGKTPYGETANRVASWLYGTNDPRKPDIDALLKATGMTYEQAFWKGDSE